MCTAVGVVPKVIIIEIVNSRINKRRDIFYLPLIGKDDSMLRFRFIFRFFKFLKKFQNG
jgi:hypothetical protein